MHGVSGTLEVKLRPTEESRLSYSCKELRVPPLSNKETPKGVMNYVMNNYVIVRHCLQVLCLPAQSPISQPVLPVFPTLPTFPFMPLPLTHPSSSSFSVTSFTMSSLTTPQQAGADAPPSILLDHPALWSPQRTGRSQLAWLRRRVPMCDVVI